ncbi:NAD(P)H-dependent oxidoreductase [Neisseria sp. Ec49-e6-T10]|uniref:NAD(P)H-dependent oxidoreductase n=1 Tax=Neisseria sp. Ec49-e6-T10 TaxID=3140744 RepID=UPI003EBB0C2F
MNEFTQAMKFRHACKLFDQDKSIPAEQFDQIMEAARLSPSSFGLEHWHFLVIESPKVKEALKPTCWNQPQVTSCSHFVVILSKKAHFFEKGSDYIKQSFKRRTKDDQAKLDGICNMLENFFKNDLNPTVSIESWAKMQCYLAGANMMTAAAALGIDSCPMEGFNYTQFKDTLTQQVNAFNPEDYDIAFCVAFGYRTGEQTEAFRWSTEQIATFIK